MKKRLISIAINLVLILITLTGCWDKVEINDRLFVTALGIDVSDAPLTRPYNISYEIPNLGKWKDGLDIKGEDFKFIKTQKGETFYQASIRINSNIPGKLYYGYTRAAILGEDFTNNSKLMKQLFEGFERDNEIDRGMYILTTKGKAEDILKAQTQILPYTGLYIREIYKGLKENDFLKIATMDKVVQEFKQSGNTMIPLIFVKEKNQYQLKGAVILKDFKYFAEVTAEQLTPLLFLKNEIKNGVIDIPVQGVLVPFEVTDSSLKYKVEQNLNGTLTLHVIVKAEGEINTFTYDTPRPLMNEDYLEQLTKHVEKELSQTILDSMRLTQKQWKIDVIHLLDYIRKYYPDIYTNVKQNWNYYYTNMNVDVNVGVQIRRIGSIK